MNVKRLFLSTMVLLLLFSVTSYAKLKKAADVTIKTDSANAWEVKFDKDPQPKLNVITGPTQKSKAIQLNYSFADGTWIALVKKVGISLDVSQGIQFKYRGTGTSANLSIKIMDDQGTVFGYTTPKGTISPAWETAIAQRMDFKYLWGGNGASSMKWDAINQIEFTIDGPQNQNVSSKLAISKIKVVAIKKSNLIKRSVGGAASSKIASVKKTKSGTYIVREMYQPSYWSSVVDQDGSCKVSVRSMIINQKKKKVLQAKYSFGLKGVWNAMALNTNFDLANAKMLKFYFKGEGGANILELKVVDSNQAVFGYEIKYPTNISKWTKVIIPKSGFKYLYGGSSGSSPNWSKITKLEYTIRKGDSGNNADGKILLRSLQYK